MPVVTPGRRWQHAYKPFKKETLGNRTLIAVERMFKGPVYGCRMCGNCLLQETAFICPMACPKGLRNGPCGGSTPEYCYVDETRPCIWFKIYEKSFKKGREEKLLEILPPMDWDKVGGETWGDVVRQAKQVGFRRFLGGRFTRDKEKKHETWEAVFQPVRQPDWWLGDAEYHAPGYDEPASALERRLKAGEFVITSEVAPPMGAATGKLKRDIEMIKPYVAAVNFTDCPSATPRMSSQACSMIALGLGAEPVMQIAARDRTRVGVQAEVVGAAALGIPNMLCLSGDSPVIGPGPRSRMSDVDIESVQMLWMLRRLRDEGAYLDGRKIKTPPKFFLGAAGSPFASNPKFQALREEKKINAGAQFFQTNLVYDADGLDVWLSAMADRDILDKVFILVGVTPLKNYRMARYLNDAVPGVFIPEPLLKRLEDAGDGAEEEGVQIALELIDQIKDKEGVNGFHLMPVMWESIVPRIVTESGLLPPDFVAPENHAELTMSPA
jgi:methylenetetrahydrofolate reductase (NADPH)